MGSVDQHMVLIWHQMLWLGREMEATIGLANKDLTDTIFNPVVPGVAPTCECHPVFLSRSSPHIAHLTVGDGQVIFYAGTYQLEVGKARPTDADATVSFALGAFIPPARPATAW